MPLVSFIPMETKIKGVINSPKHHNSRFQFMNFVSTYNSDIDDIKNILLILCFLM